MSQNHAALPPQQATSGSEPPPEGQYTGEGVTDALSASSDGQLMTFTPSVHYGPDSSVTFQGLAGMSARINNDSRCHECGEPFRSGDEVTAYLAVDPDEAIVRHGRCVR